MKYDGLTEDEHKRAAETLINVMDLCVVLSQKYKKTGTISKRANRIYNCVLELRSDLDDDLNVDGVYYGGDR